MKIAIATEDRIHIARRTGRAAEFALFEIIDGKLINLDYVKNTHNHKDHEHNKLNQQLEHTHSHKDLVEKLKGVDLFFVTHLGPHFKVEIQEAGIPFEIVKEELIENLIRPFIK